jgi:bifunctional polynucleotide phosphatase/kinase
MENIVLQPSKMVNSYKLAIFDFDWTMVRPTKGKKFPKDENDWVWWRPSVPKVLKQYANNDYRMVIVTDQTKEWKVKMIQTVIKTLKIPFTVIIGMQKNFQKPNPALFQEAISEFDNKNSIYVGDAAGREGDWANKDKVFAESLNIPFYTPEEVFPMEYRNFPKIKIPKHREVIVMVGFPGSGKSTFIHTQLVPKNYYIVDGDILKTPDKMLKDADNHLNQSIVFDATNGTKERRKIYIDFAKEHNLPVRCVWVATPIEEALESVKLRHIETGKNVPAIALMTYQKKFEEPTDDECEIIKV